MIIFYYHTLTIDKNGVTKTISIGRASLATSINTNAGRGEERNYIEGKGTIIENEHQVPEDEVAEKERCDTEDTPTHPEPVANRNIDAHKPREFKD